MLCSFLKFLLYLLIIQTAGLKQNWKQSKTRQEQNFDVVNVFSLSAIFISLEETETKSITSCTP